MKRIKIEKATPAHLKQLKGRFRREDDLECLRASGSDAYEASVDGFKSSDACFVGILDSVPFAVFGVATLSITALGRKGVPWMLGTDEFKTLDKECRKYVFEESMKFLNSALEVYDLLENYVDATNTVAIEYLKRLGFIFEEAKPYGIDGFLFHRFYMRKEKVYV